jgi:hypothetical protein
VIELGFMMLGHWTKRITQTPCHFERNRDFAPTTQLGCSSTKDAFSSATLLWQCRRMPKAYRTDVITHPKFQAELGKNAVRPERVQCPVAGCECTYDMYGSHPSNHVGNINILRGRLEREHPGHTSEVLAVNAYRKSPR